MAKKKASGTGKTAAKAAKKAKAAAKVEKKEKKKTSKSKSDNPNEEDLESILDQLQKEWVEAHTVTEELVEGPPSRRVNATLVPCPSGDYLWCIGGEYFSEDNKAYFYNDVFRYSPEKDEWRKFVSPTCPGPRSAHAAVASPAGGGKIFLFGGEFSSVNQSTFHHYRDFWCFDITMRSWDRIETRERPTARSGHRMAIWKHYIILFGGFYDPGLVTKYLDDLWLFDTQEYRWQQMVFKETDRRPSARSGFSFLPTTEGIVLYGGYCKEYKKGKRPVGVMLNDTWLLRMTIPTADVSATQKSSKASPQANIIVKWEPIKKKSTAFAPSLRSGCTMSLWAAKNTGILFGGVTDEDKHEETLESVFWNDLYGYQLPTGETPGRWLSMGLKKPKQARKKKQTKVTREAANQNDEDSDNDVRPGSKQPASQPITNPDSAIDDPNESIPLPRYNAMLAVLRNTLYLYGGIFEKGSREYTLDDFYSLPLDKLDRYTCLRENTTVIAEEDESSSGSEDDGSEDDDDDDDDDDDSYDVGDSEDSDAEKNGDEDGGKSDVSTETESHASDEKIKRKKDRGKKALVETKTPSLKNEDKEPENSVTVQAVASTDADAPKDSEDDPAGTPLPGETLAMFYRRTRDHWSNKALEAAATKGKQLHRDAFTLAEARFVEYRPTQMEMEKILNEAGLDNEELKQGLKAARQTARGGENRNRR